MLLIAIILIPLAAVVYEHTSQKAVEPVVYIGKTGSKYHKANCPTLNGNGIPVDLEDALNMGKEPCKICIN